MKETEMEHRGSISNYKFVKEQRLYGSWHGKYNPCLRYNLMGFERNYQVKILSNQINKVRFYSTTAIQSQINPNLLNPNFITGFTDAEGSFIISIQREPRNKTG
jgi:hypothetical protein